MTKNFIENIYKKAMRKKSYKAADAFLLDTYADGLITKEEFYELSDRVDKNYRWCKLPIFLLFSGKI